MASKYGSGDPRTALADTMIADYSETLVDPTKKLAVKYFQTGNTDADMQMAVVLFTYVLKEILHWSFEDAIGNLSKKVIKDLGLTAAYNKLNFPAELSPDRDVFWVAACVWPNQGMFSKKELAVLMYRNVLASSTGKFPKNYFMTSEHGLRAASCFNYALNITLGYENSEDIYSFFADENRAGAWFKRYRLDAIKDGFYDTSLDAAHSLLPASLRDDNLYQLFKCMGPVYTFVNATKNRSMFNTGRTETRQEHSAGSVKGDCHKNYKKSVGAEIQAAIKELMRPANR